MIKYSELKEGELLRIVGAGAPGYANLGDIVKVTKIMPNGVAVVDKHNSPCEFVFDCGRARLEKTEYGVDSSNELSQSDPKSITEVLSGSESSTEDYTGDPKAKLNPPNKE